MSWLLLSNGLHEGAITSWLHFPRFAAESFGPPTPKVRLAYVEQVDDEQQEHPSSSWKASGPPGLRLKGSPLDVEEQM